LTNTEQFSNSPIILGLESQRTKNPAKLGLAKKLKLKEMANGGEDMMKVLSEAEKGLLGDFKAISKPSLIKDFKTIFQRKRSAKDLKVS